MNAIRLGMAGCYDEIAVLCLLCNVLSKMLNAHVAFYPMSRARPVYCERNQ